MQKVLNRDLEIQIEEIISQKKSAEEKAAEVVELLRVLQDSSGIKVCQNITWSDLL